MRRPAIFDVPDVADHLTWNSWHMSGIERKACIAPRHAFGLLHGFACATPPALGPVFPFPASVNTPCPHSSDHMQYKPPV